MNSINLTPIIQAIIALLAALITCKLIPWIQSRTTEKQRDNLRALIRVLVFAAEQLYGAGRGADKLDYVCQQLRERGFEVDVAEIEAAVYNAFNWDALSITPPLANTPVVEGGVDVNMDHWSLEQLRDFCQANHIPADGCETREDFLRVIEFGGRVSDEPPQRAAEGRGME